jgi:branched-chain amino acid transport system permease protein
MNANQRLVVAAAVAVLALAAPWVAYPVFLMTALCFALFACAFNLLLGYAGLMSFGHAMFFGMAGYFYGHVVKAWDMPPELGLCCGDTESIAETNSVDRPALGEFAIERDGHAPIVGRERA